MKRVNKLPDIDDEMRPHYDFSNAARNPYAALIEPSSRAIPLDDDIAKVFVSSHQIDKSLRYLLEFACAHKKFELIGKMSLHEPLQTYASEDAQTQTDRQGDVYAMMIAPDILAVFPTAEAINAALRTLIYLTAHSEKVAA